MGLKISASKSNYMVFGFGFIWYFGFWPNIGLYMYGSPLERVKANILGIWFEEWMTWAVQVSKILLKCEKVLNVMRSLAGCEWGADRETMLLMFQALIRSSLDYGCFVLQARVPALLIEMGEMPLWLRHIKLGLQHWLKLNGCHQTFPARCLLQESDGGNKYKTFLVNINQWAGRLRLEQVSVAEHTSCLPMPYWVLPELNTELVFLQEKDKKLVTPKIAEHLNSFREITFIIFTDGSRDPGSGRAGFGMYVEQLGVKIGRRISDGSWKP